MVKLRLARAGARKRPFYRIVAIDERERRDGRPLELLGTYDPVSQPERIVLRQDRVDAWLARGACMTDAVRSLVRRAPRGGEAPPAEAPVAEQPAQPGEGAA